MEVAFIIENFIFILGMFTIEGFEPVLSAKDGSLLSKCYLDFYIGVNPR